MEVGIVRSLYFLSGLIVASSFKAGEFSVVDLTHEWNSDTVYWGLPQGFLFTVLFRGRTPEGFWFETNKFETVEHGGTHLDAPSHAAKGKWRVHQIPAERLVCPGVVVDVRRSASVNADYELSVSDLVAWERQYGPIPDGAVIFLYSGWATRYPNKTLMFNSNNPSDNTTFHYPGFHPDSIDWLIQNRNISIVGTDTPSLDTGKSRVFLAHRKFSDANLLGLENVNNLNKIPPSGSTIFVGAPKLFDASGVPSRVLALVSDKY